MMDPTDYARLRRAAFLLHLGLMSIAPSALAEQAELPATNPLAQPSSLPFGAPRFDRIKDSDFQPAIEAGMRAELAEYEAIADDPETPGFDNTIVAMERAGRLLARANGLFQNLVSANANATLRKVNEEEAPRLQAHSDAILLDPKLFARVKALYDRRDTLGLDDRQKFLLTRYYTRFVRAGAQLSDGDKTKLRTINERIAKLQTQFRDRLQAATADAAVVVSDKAALDGLAEDDIAAAAEDAKARNLPGQYLIAITNTTQQPVLASLKNRELRARILAASESRGDLAGPNDQRETIAALAKLRAERARLLGFDSFAAYVLDDQMAKTPAAAEKLLRDLVPAATAKARQEAGEIQSLIDAQKGGFALAASDWPLYAEQVRRAKFDVDEAETRQYFVLDRVLEDGVFFAANRLYGITFKPRTDIPVYDPDMRVWEVFDADGASLALFYGDFYARPNKDGGAWCNYLNQPSGLLGAKPLIVNVSNIAKPAPGAPALIGFDDVTTLFHEFGHALHAMFSVQQYPTENGFNLPTDVIEFPSQFNEHWALDPIVLASYAKHYQTGAVIPAALVDKIKRARTYGEGYATTEVVAAALLDLEWHTLPASAPEQAPDAFEAAALKRNGIDLPQVPPRYRSPYFLHIWANGYEANYYSYLWGEILDDDAFEWFEENGGLTRANGQRLREMFFAPGYAGDPMALYRAFRGRDPSADALKRQRGLE